MGNVRSKRKVVILCVAAFYSPYGWLLLVESLWPWNAPHWTWTQPGITPWTWTPHHCLWFKLWPILPGWIPTMWFNAVIGFGRLADSLEFLIGGLVTAAMLCAICWAALRGGYWTILTIGATFLVSCLLSWQAYSFYAW